MTFHDRIKSCRLSAGLTQEQVAKGIRVHRTMYNLLENGKRNGTTETISAIADFHGVSVDYLLGRTDDPNSHKQN